MHVAFLTCFGILCEFFLSKSFESAVLLISYIDSCFLIIKMRLLLHIDLPFWKKDACKYNVGSSLISFAQKKKITSSHSIHIIPAKRALRIK